MEKLEKLTDHKCSPEVTGLKGCPVCRVQNLMMELLKLHNNPRDICRVILVAQFDFLREYTEMNRPDGNHNQVLMACFLSLVLEPMVDSVVAEDVIEAVLGMTLVAVYNEQKSEGESTEDTLKYMHEALDKASKSLKTSSTIEEFLTRYQAPAEGLH